MLRMRLGLVGIFILGGLGTLLLYTSALPALALADPIGHDSILTAGAATGAGFLVAERQAARLPAPGVVKVAIVVPPTQGSGFSNPASAPTLTSTLAGRAPASPSATPTLLASQTPANTPVGAVTTSVLLSATTTTRPAPSSVSPTRPAPPGSQSPGPTAATLPPTLQPPTSAAPPRPAGVGAAVNGCGDISQAGSYRLTTPLTAGTDCLHIHSSNVTLDCAGQSITGTNFKGSGIQVNRFGLFGSTSPANVEIRGCRISGFQHGIWVEAASNIYFHENDTSGNATEVDDSRFGIFLGLAESAGIRLNATQGGRIEGNTSNGGAVGIDVRASSGIQVRGNTASNNSAWGINLLQTSGSLVADNTTTDNWRRCTWGKGSVGPGCDSGGIILQNAASGNTVTHNRVVGKNGNGVFIKAHGIPCGDNNTISNNTIDGALYNGIEISFCKNNVVAGNEIANNLDGIWIGFVTSTTIRDNNIHDERNHGIISYNSRNSEISNNTLVNDREGIYSYYEPVNPNEYWWFNAASYRSEKNCICNNQIYKNGASGIHLNNTTQSQIVSNVLRFNNLNMWFEGDSEGNVIQNNIQQALGAGRWLALFVPASLWGSNGPPGN